MFAIQPRKADVAIGKYECCVSTGKISYALSKAGKLCILLRKSGKTKFCKCPAKRTTKLLHFERGEKAEWFPYALKRVLGGKSWRPGERGRMVNNQPLGVEFFQASW